MLYAIVFISFAILVALFRFKKSRRPISVQGAREKTEDEESEFEDYNEKFLNNFGDNTMVKFVRAFNQNDVAVIRSLLADLGINTYVEFENVNNLYPGIAVGGYADLIIAIYERDLFEARIAVMEFIENLKHDSTMVDSAARIIPEIIA
ncbi:MAG: hypothetical protein WCT14_06260 [Treponemataceae bacterium]